MLVEGYGEGGPGAVAVAPLVLLSVRVANFDHIREAFGEDEATATGEVLDMRLAEFLNGALRIERLGPDRWEAVLLQRVAAADSGALLLSALLRHLSAPVECGDHAILACVHAGMAALDATSSAKLDADPIVDREELEARLDAVHGLPQPGRSANWRRGYRLDMAHAVELWRDLHAGHLRAGWQPIVPADEGAGFLYQELRLCSEPVFADGEGVDRVVERARGALERLGLTHWFDLWLLHLVIEELHATPLVRLGCLISAQTTLALDWWAGVFAELAAAPGLGGRLVIAIGGRQPGLESAQLFGICRTLKGHGVAIALQDMELGQIVALEPDIVKIGGTLLRWASNDALSPMGGGELVRLIALSRGGGRTVVVEGVGTNRLRAVAIAAGADWLQGEVVATVRLSAPWPVVLPSSSPSPVPAAEAAQRPLFSMADSAADEDGLALRGVLMGLPLSLALWGALVGLVRWLI